MKAIRIHTFGEPDVMKLETTADPQPGTGQVVVRVKAAGVNPVETYIRAGKYGPRPFPFTPGNDAAGEIAALGPDVTRWKIGDRVYTDRTVSGSYAELALCDLPYVHRLPAKISFQQGATIGIAAGTAYRGLFQRGRGLPGDVVLIHGATGGVGTAAVQLARAAGMIVVGTSSTEAGRRYVLEQGAHHSADHQITERKKDVDALTDGKGFDLILEFLADKNLASDLASVARNGRIVVIGSRGKIEIEPRETMSRESEIIGLMLNGATEREHRAIYSALTASLEDGILRPVIGMEIPLAEAARAHREIMEGESHGKIVLIP
jgi:NADPH2:quinone reductase